MTDEERAKADAEPGQKLDKILECVDGLSKRMDAVEADARARKDAEEKERRDREDKARKDGEKEPGKTEPERVAADNKRKDGDGESEEDKKAREDAERREREDKARRDAEEAEEKARKDREREDAARKDAADQAQRIAELAARLPKVRTDDDYAAAADAQARADEVYQAFGDSAPPALNGESVGDYERRLASGLKRHSPRWKDVDLYKQDDAVAAIAVKDIYADAAAAALAPPDDLPPGQFQEVVKPNRLTGGRIIEFRGRGTFIGAMKRPAMRVASIQARKAVN